MKLKLKTILFLYIFYGCSAYTNKPKSVDNCNEVSSEPYSLKALKKKYQCVSTKKVSQ